MVPIRLRGSVKRPALSVPSKIAESNTYRLEIDFQGLGRCWQHRQQQNPPVEKPRILKHNPIYQGFSRRVAADPAWLTKIHGTLRR
jgi:hypothetical protein